MLAPLHPPTLLASDSSVRRPVGATAGFAFRLTRQGDAPHVATAARSAPASCGWVASAAGPTTRRTT
jgi:hypothetical protein